MNTKEVYGVVIETSCSLNARIDQVYGQNKGDGGWRASVKERDVLLLVLPHV